MNKILNMGAGKRTYIVALIMVVHAVTQIVLDISAGKTVDGSTFNEFFTGAGIFFLRKAI